MFDLNRIVRKNILGLTPYSCARDEFDGHAAVFLDANENSLGTVLSSEMNRYPDPMQRELKRRIADQRGIAVEPIFLGHGSDEAIDLLLRVFCNPGIDQVITMPPTYGMYAVSAEINNTAVKEVPLTPSFQIDLNSLMSSIKENTKIIFVCSPNNPTGNCINQNSIKEVLTNFHGIVVIDEAYIDFCPENSLLADLDTFPNLAILQTFSKAWGLAGLRLGMAFASSAIIDLLNKVKLPYNLSSATQSLACQALSKVQQRDAMVEEILGERAWLNQKLVELPFVTEIFPSDANFLLVKTTAPAAVYQELAKRGVIVRNRSSLKHCEGCLRITVGSREQNETLLSACKDITLGV